MRQVAVGEPGHLLEQDGAGHRIVDVLGDACTAVAVHDESELLACPPDGVVVGGVERILVRTGWDAGNEDPALQAGLGDPVDLGDRVVDVIEQDLGDPRPPAGQFVAEVDHPPVVGLERCPAVFVLLP